MKETIKKCEEFGFNEEITREMLWNTAYQLGRSRWHWGPSWFVNFQGWINTQISKLKPEPSRLVATITVLWFVMFAVAVGLIIGKVVLELIMR